MSNRIARVLVGLLVATLGVTSSVGATGGPGGLGDEAVSYRVISGEVVIVCPLTVGGSFEARTNDLRGDVTHVGNRLGAVEGALHVNLESLETGIGLRDRHMRDNYLEVQKGPEYARATLEQIRVERLEGKTTMKATLILHGQRREITGTAQLKPQKGQLWVEAEFPVKVADFQIAKPSYLGVGVRDEVRVKVTMTAIPSPAAVVAAVQR